MEVFPVGGVYAPKLWFKGCQKH